MKKTRMSIDDIHAMVGSLAKNVLNMRVTNIYDLAGTGGDKGSGASKTYILKLHQPPFPKIFLLLESGVRFHTSKYARDASSAGAAALPSQFTMKLRKHLRGKRLVGLQQLEGDRVVDFTFGTETHQCHLILELYASGNIILTDEKYTILSLLRTHRFDENVKMAVRQVYPVSVLENRAAPPAIHSATDLIIFVDHWFAEQEMRAVEGKGKRPKAQTLKQLLLAKDSTFGGLGPVIVEHCIVSAELSPALKIKNPGEFKAIGVTELARLVEELHKGWTLLERLQTQQKTVIMEAAEGEDDDDDDDNHLHPPMSAEKFLPPPAPLSTPTTLASEVSDEKRGFIILKEKASLSEPEQFEEFTPFLYAQHRVGNKQIRSFATFDEAVDEYFSHFEAQNAEAARQSAKAAAENKLEKLRKNQKLQIDQLVEVQEKSFKHAQLIEANQQDVENVLLVVRSALASGMDWRGLEELVNYEQKNGNPVACLIHELDLAHNRVAILLCDNDDDEEEIGEEPAQEDAEAHVIWIDLSLSALANAREIYSKKKKAGEKVKKATEATERAIEQAERNTKKTLQKQQMKRHVIYQRRKTMWFEKFHWFLSNEQYLVIAGKDAHQNELLVKRYLRRGDVYVHADIHGAATCIVRNRSPTTPIPVATLEQAGCMSVCRSHAWTNQVIAGAYWVNADQVSKTAPAGEYLTTGSFMIRGKKNYINPSRLEMGLAIVFRVDESSVANHKALAEEDAADNVEGYNAKEQEDEDIVQDKDVMNPNAPGEPISEVTESRNLDVELEPIEAAPREKLKEVHEVNPGTAEKITEAPPSPRADVSNDVSVGAECPGGDAKDEDDNIGARDGKKRLTAKQRRDLKKGRIVQDATQPSDEMRKQTDKTSNKTTAKNTESVAAAKAVRGKKGKLKKMKKKYADQDDDDRRIRMEALGHSVVDDDEFTEQQQNENNDDEVNNEAASDGVDGAEEDNEEAQQRTAEYIRLQREKKEKYLEQEEEEADGDDFFDSFTGSPLPNDIVLYAMPMCAPYAALHKYKYKVKLLPGAVKKGKAAKSAMEYFLAQNLKEEKDAVTKRKQQSPTADDCDDDAETPDVDHVVVQRELLRCVPENELVMCMVGPVKISAPGLHGAGNKAGGKKGGGKKGKK